MAVLLGMTAVGCGTQTPDAGPGTTSTTPTPSSSSTGASTSSSSAPAASTTTPTSRTSASATTTTPLPSPSTVTRVSLRIAVSDTSLVLTDPPCADGCTVTAWTRVGDATVSAGTRAFVPGSVLRWTIPTRLTRSLAFTLKGLGGTGSDVYDQRTTTLVMQYSGVDPGVTLTPEEAAAQTSATGCWIGTTREEVELRARADVTLFGIPLASPGAPHADDLWWTSTALYTVPMAGGTGAYLPTYYGGLYGPSTPVCP